MPIVGSKEFAQLSQALGAVADGVKKHAADQGFPSVLKEDKLRIQRKSLEDGRAAYEQLQAQTDQAHEKYAGLVKQAGADVAGAQRLLQGYHGLRSEVLKDYGFTPPKPGGRKGQRPKTSAAPK